MTKMKKKILLIVSLCLIMVGVFGCGSDANATYNGYTADQLAANNTGILDELMGMSDEDLLMYQSYGDQMDASTMKVINSWTEVKDEVGDFVGYGEVVVTEANGTTTVEQTAEFTGRDVKTAARRGYVDRIVDYADTRKYLVAAFEMLFTKNVEQPYKKHGAK